MAQFGWVTQTLFVIGDLETLFQFCSSLIEWQSRRNKQDNKKNLERKLERTRNAWVKELPQV